MFSLDLNACLVRVLLNLSPDLAGDRWIDMDLVLFLMEMNGCQQGFPNLDNLQGFP